MNAIFEAAEERDCLDLVLRVIALYSKRDAEHGWLGLNEVRHGPRNLR